MQDELLNNNTMERVILICNFNNNTSSGIGKILGRAHINDEFVVNYLYKDNRFIISDAQPFLFIKQNQISYTEFDGWQILLLSDSKCIEMINTYIDKNTLIMYHSFPPEADFMNSIKNKLVKGIKRGYHEILGKEKNGYPFIIDLIETYNSKGFFNEKEYLEMFNRLIAWFNEDEELEAKLELLHKCLLPNESPDILPKELIESESKEKYIKAYNIFILQRNKCLESNNIGPFSNEVANVAFNKVYISALIELRIILLGS